MHSLRANIFPLFTFAIITVAPLKALADDAPVADFDLSHALFAGVLTNHVDESGRVDYAGIQERPDELRAYLREVAMVEPQTYRRWTHDQQLAFLLNLYNAQTIDLVIRHYPLRSIRDIGSLLRGAGGQPVVNLFGRITSLDSLEHKIIRPVFRDPRIIFALAGAAKSAPPLRNEPYAGERLNAQLEDQARRFINDPSRNRYDPAQQRMDLSMVFSWSAADFEEAAGSVAEYVRAYLPGDIANAFDPSSLTVQYATYDWSLNDTR